MDVHLTEEVAFERVRDEFRMVFPEPLPKGTTSVSASMPLFVRQYRMLRPIVEQWEAEQRGK